MSIWKASRGFGGKTQTLGTLVQTEAVTLGAQVTVLGGSAAQSLRVHEVSTECWEAPNAPTSLIAREPTRYETRLTNGSWIRALLASQRSVRGPHPQRLRLDEIDEMELEILEAAQGQPMSARGVETQTVMSSTHQYPDKTMTAMLVRAQENNWPVYQWCWRESSNETDGWLRPQDVARKRQEVSSAMFAIEYDLQEPSFEGRAIDVELVEKAFSRSLGSVPGEAHKAYHFQAPEEGHRYVTGVDWAKEKDWTIIATFDATDPDHWVAVAWERTARKPWPIMVQRLDARLARYGGLCAHDATGIGNVVEDLIAHKVYGKVMAGRFRNDMLADYVAGIENLHIIYPRIDYAFNEHKYATLDDIYGHGHVPDSIVAGALAWSLRSKIMYGSFAAVAIPRESGESPWRGWTVPSLTRAEYLNL